MKLKRSSSPPKKAVYSRRNPAGEGTHAGPDRRRRPRRCKGSSPILARRRRTASLFDVRNVFSASWRSRNATRSGRPHGRLRNRTRIKRSGGDRALSRGPYQVSRPKRSFVRWRRGRARDDERHRMRRVVLSRLIPTVRRREYSAVAQASRPPLVRSEFLRRLGSVGFFPNATERTLSTCCRSAPRRRPHRWRKRLRGSSITASSGKLKSSHARFLIYRWKSAGRDGTRSTRPSLSSGFSGTASPH